LQKPAPKKVAMVQAHFVGFSIWGRALLEPELVFIRVSIAAAAEAAEIFEDFGVEDGRADLVDTHGPLAEVDFAAAVAAEGEVFVVEADEHAAGGAMEELAGFFL
jgi:hypothetical protein